MKHNNDEKNHHKAMLKDFQKRFWISLIVTIPILLLSPTIQKILTIKITFPADEFVLFSLASFVFFYGGWPFLKGITKELQKRQPGMMTLIALAITVAYGYSSAVIFFIPGKTFFWELATLIDVMLLGHWIEMRSTMAASRALEKLAKLLPTKAHLVLEDETVKDIDLENLKASNPVLIKPGEKIPADGKIIKGESSVNESMLTGESNPIHKKLGDKVIGGSINSTGSLIVAVEKTGKDSYIAQVIKLVEEAQHSKSRAQTLADKAAAWLTLIAITVGTITLITWLLLASEAVFAIERMVTVMVITCPHALGLAIPLVISVITTISARSGILIRNRAQFERARKLDVIMFDKTGTLTKGKLEVTDVVGTGEWDENEVLAKAASVEINSEHYIALSIVKKTNEKKLQIPSSTNFKAFPGKGVASLADSTHVFIGNKNILKEAKIILHTDSHILKTIEKLESEGKTVVYVCGQNKIQGAIALNDVIRPESKEACKKLKELGYDIAMITGDNEQTANNVAKQLGIDIVFAQVLPDQKANKIKLLQQANKTVAMVGDGINDAPALMQSDVGIAIGAGTDVAIESADVILTQNNPYHVVNMIKLSKVTNRKTIQNLAWATGYNLVTIPLAAGVLYNFGITLPPALGALIMSLSTVIVAINSILIRKHS